MICEIEVEDDELRVAAGAEGEEGDSEEVVGLPTGAGAGADYLVSYKSPSGVKRSASLWSVSEAVRKQLEKISSKPIAIPPLSLPPQDTDYPSPNNHPLLHHHQRNKMEEKSTPYEQDMSLPSTYTSLSNFADNENYCETSRSNEDIASYNNCPLFNREQVVFLAHLLNASGDTLLEVSIGDVGKGLIVKLIQVGACDPSVLDHYVPDGEAGKSPLLHHQHQQQHQHQGQQQGKEVGQQKRGGLMKPSSPDRDLIPKSTSMDEIALYGKENRFEKQAKSKRKELYTASPSSSPPTTSRSMSSSPPETSSLYTGNSRPHKAKTGLAFLFGKCAVAHSPPLHERKFKPTPQPKSELSPSRVRRSTIKLFSRNSSSSEDGSEYKGGKHLVNEDDPLKKILCLEDIIQRSSVPKPPVMKENENISAICLVNWLLEQMAHRDEDVGDEALNTLLDTYRTVTTPLSLLLTLLNIWETGNHDIKDRVFKVLKRWLSVYYNNDFVTKDATLLSELANFIDVENRKPGQNYGHNLRRIFLTNYNLQRNRSTPFTPPYFLDTLPGLLSEKIAVAAKKLFWIEGKTFIAIDPVRMLDLGASEPMVAKLVAQFNQVSTWIATEIVSTENAKQRVIVLKTAIKLANACKEKENFNSLMEILAGLNMATVQRLKKTWSSLPSKYYNLYKELEDLMHHHSNFTNYRRALAQCTGGIPYLGIFLRDITFIENGNLPMNEDNTSVNMHRIQLLANVMQEFRKFQGFLQQTLEKTLNIGPSRPVSVTSASIADAFTPEVEEQLRKMSFKCEPPPLAKLMMDDDTSSTSMFHSD